MKTVTKTLFFSFFALGLFVAGLLFASSAQAGAYYPDYDYNYNYNYMPVLPPQYPACTFHAYRDCVSNAVYWFDSCGRQQDFVQACSGGALICQYGQCVPKTVKPPAPVYIKNYSKKCFKGNVYWYDSLGYAQTLYKNCNDGNECTKDSCAAAKCANELLCDSTTCQASSPDFAKYCASAQPAVQSYSVAFFAKKDEDAVSLDRAVSLGPNGSVYFLAVLKNDSNVKIDNILVLANIPTEVAMLGNLKIDNVPEAGDIVSGITIASLPAGVSKTITFEGKTQSFENSGEKQATIIANVGAQSKSGSLTITLNPDEKGENEKPVAGGSVFLNFLKRWYLWILAAIVLVFLFVVIFRRLSSNA